MCIRDRLNPRQIWSFQDGGLSFLGGFLGAFLLVQIFILLTGSTSKRLLDTAVPSLVLASAISRIGNTPGGLPVSSSLPWALEVKGEYQHPDQVYLIIMLYIFCLLYTSGIVECRVKTPERRSG